MSADRNNVISRRSNTWFTAAAVFAGVLVGAHFADGVRPEEAMAQQPREDKTPPPFNSAGDRKVLIEQLTELNTKLARIEAKFNTGINVKVTEMPAMKEGK
ncbi:MAG: hypothetical protein IT438_16575 [Phycisphaerales bacterium]|nr:hypothetical protein [Phycisphaerales bacterium]